MSPKAQGLAREHFGVVGTIRALPGERTRNFVIDDGTDRFVLKLNPLSEKSDVALEIAALSHLAAKGPSTAVPSVRPTLTGAATVEVEFDGAPRIARMLTWLPGRTWEEAGRPDPVALTGLGRLVARLDAALADFEHPALDRPLRWNLAAADRAIELVAYVIDPQRRRVATRVLAEFADRFGPALAALPVQAIHGDANDRNVLVTAEGQVTGLIDFGDLCRAPRVCGLAIACAYAMFGHDDPVLAVAPLVAGYAAEVPLSQPELALLFDLIRTRLAVSMVMAGWQHSLDPANDYLLASQDDVWKLLLRLESDQSAHAHYRFRTACGLEPVPHAAAIRAFIDGAVVAPLLGRPMAQLRRAILDWSVDAPARPESSAEVAQAIDAVGADVGIGRYGEDRDVYRSDAFAATSPGGARRSIHLGIDLFAAPGQPIFSPLDGRVAAFADNAAPLDYEPVIVLEHRTSDEVPFYTLYGHLSRESLLGLEIGASITAGQQFAAIGRETENGGWPPHVHLQLLTDLLGMGVNIFGVAPADEAELWASVSLNPALVLGVGPAVRLEMLAERPESKS